jgi:thioredoxin reductase (NADPH)
MTDRRIEKLVIIGSGPAGHTAAIYAARANLEPVLLAGFAAGGAPGGQLNTTGDVENFPGFPDGIAGPELTERFAAQSLRFGTRMFLEDVEAIELAARPFRVRTAERELWAQTVIVATGATARRLHLPGEERLWGRGISACAVCDGALPAFRERPLVVVGGGDTAVEEALHLCRFASEVTVVHRRDRLRASKIMQERLLAQPKVRMVWNATVEEALGDRALDGVRVRDVRTGEARVIDASGLFYAVGHTPNTRFLDGQVALDDAGYIVTAPGTTRTSVMGCFAAGDVQDRKWRQAITAAASGCMAALEAERFLFDSFS